MFATVVLNFATSPAICIRAKDVNYATQVQLQMFDFVSLIVADVSADVV